MTAESLSEFLLARYADDEEAARYVESVNVSWHRRWGGRVDRVSEVTPPDVAAPFTPTRVLADVKAKRRIVALHEMVPADQPQNGRTTGCLICDYDRDYGVIGGECETLQALALPYADHPDYRQEWKP